MVQVLICQHNGHSWERESSRGRKPMYCPDHDPRAAVATPDPDAVTETLTCAAGHTWERPRTRGRKPPHCPEHRVGVAQDGVERAKGLPSVDIRPPAVQAVLDGPLTELYRKLEYTVHELEHPAAWREHGDWTLLIETHKRLTQQAEKMSRPVPVYVPEIEHDVVPA